MMPVICIIFGNTFLSIICSKAKAWANINHKVIGIYMSSKAAMLSFIGLAAVFSVVLAGLSAPTASAANVTRNLSLTTVDSGDNVVVDLTVDVDSASEAYAIEESYPDGWSVVNAGGLNDNEDGLLKIAVVEDAQDVVYQYTVRAPSAGGNYSWHGMYIFESMSDEELIQGADQVYVIGSPGGGSGDSDDDSDDDGGGSGGGGGGGVCTPSWQCTAWSECLDGEQSRVCTDQNSCGTEEGKPSEEQVCTPPGTGILQECHEEWSCSDWSECLEGVHNRTCVDMNSCGTEEEKPPETGTCEMSAFPEFMTFFIYAIIGVAIIIFSMLILRELRS